MSETYYSPEQPTFQSIIDLLPKVGEKALLAWLHFHSWKPMHYASQRGILLPFSLSKIIRRLKVGKATFYHHIIEPLKAHGLIDVVPSEDAKQEHNLILYTFPYNIRETFKEPQHATPPDPLRNKTSYVPIETPSILSLEPVPESISTCSETEPHPSPYENENHSEPETEPVLSFYQPGSETIPVPSIIHDESISYTLHTDLKEDKPKDKKEKDRSDPDLPIPEKLTTALDADPLLQSHSRQIMKAYRECCTHPSFTLDSFLTKMEQCIRYPHDPQCFASYLRKALLNEWTNTSFPKKTGSPTPLKPPKTTDIPEWIQRQEENARNGTEEEPGELTPEQKAEIEALLKALEEI